MRHTASMNQIDFVFETVAWNVYVECVIKLGAEMIDNKCKSLNIEIILLTACIAANCLL